MSLILSLDEILDLHGCKCDANKLANIEHSIYSCIYTICKCIIHLLSHLATTSSDIFTTPGKYDLNLHLKCSLQLCHIYSIFTMR